METKDVFVGIVFGLVMFIGGYFSSPKLWPYVDGAPWALFFVFATIGLIMGIATLID